MATPKIKATYSLDEETVRALERTAAIWKVSKSEALRRAIRAAAAQAKTAADDPLAALDDLQDAASLRDDTAAAWEAAVRGERRESTSSRMPGE
jgi:hypothetical protein